MKEITVSMTAAQRARKNIRERAETLQVDEIQRETRRIEAEDARQKERDKKAAEHRAQREAEARLRVSERATRVVVEFEDVRVTAHPERSADPLRRQQAAHAMFETLNLVQEAFEQRVGQARAEALGKPAPAAWTTEYLINRIEDVCRHALAANMVEVTVL